MKKHFKKIACMLALMLFVVPSCVNPDSIVNQVINEQINNTTASPLDKQTENAGNTEASVSTAVNEAKKDLPIDVDLTVLSATMVYSEVYNIMSSPYEYIGKIIKMCGNFSVYRNEATGQMYYACLISDATACCAQGIEFELAGEHSYPEDYPNVGDSVTVTGVFELYEEEGLLYCRLQNAQIG